MFILYYQTFGSKELYLFFATKHLVEKNVKKNPYILMVF